MGQYCISEADRCKSGPGDNLELAILCRCSLWLVRGAESGPAANVAEATFAPAVHDNREPRMKREPGPVSHYNAQVGYARFGWDHAQAGQARLVVESS